MIYSWDFETTGLYPSLNHTPFACGIEREDGKVLLAHRGTPAWTAARKVVEDSGKIKVCHNAKFEWKMAKFMGWKPAGIVHDTFLMAHALNEYEPSLSLKALSLKYLGDVYEEEDALSEWLRKSRYRCRKEAGRNPNYSDVPRGMLDAYLEKDLDNTMRLYWMFEEPVGAYFHEAYNVERMLAEVVADMELCGVRLDIPYIKAELRKADSTLRDMERQIHELLDCKFNVASPIQLKSALHLAGYPVQDTRKETLESESAERQGDLAIDTILEWRALSKIASTFLVAFLQKAKGEYLFAQFWQCGEDEGIKTNRFSSSNPNLQNVPIRNTNVVRKAFVPRPGCCFLFADYSQIEMRLFAHYAKDNGMLRDFKQGKDIYVANASRLMRKDITRLPAKELKRQRFTSKTISLATMYGLGLRKFAAKVKLPMNKAKALRNRYFAEFPTVKGLMDECTRRVLRQGYVEDDYGRRYRVPRNLSYKAINALIQGTAAGVLKRAMLRVHSALKGTDARMLMTIHDELVVECPIKRKAEVARAMTAAMECDRFSVPLPVDMEWSDVSWADKQELA